MALNKQEQPIDTAIVIHPNLINKFSKSKDFDLLIALYVFYLRHAQLQKTNAILATNEFTQNGLGWGRDKLMRVKNQLKELGVIKMVKKKIYTYVKLCFIYTKRRVEEVINPKEQYKDKQQEKKCEVNIKKEEDEVKEITLPSPREKSELQKAMELRGISYKVIHRVERFVENIQKENDYTFNNSTLARWIKYCHQESISFMMRRV